MVRIQKALMLVGLIAMLSVAPVTVLAQDADATSVLSGLEGGTVGVAEANGLEIVYERFGSEDAEAILFIAGTGQQLIEWPLELVTTLVDEGYQVVLFDNRDVGLSTRLEEAGAPDWAAIFTALATGQPLPVAYTCKDMAQDAIGLLDALNIEQAHIVGASGGAIIAQALAATYPDRVLSLTLLMANSGNPEYPLPANPERMATAPQVAPPAGSPLEAIIEYRMQVARALSSPDFPVDEDTLRQRITRAVERSYYPVGSDRQGAAVLIPAYDEMRAMLGSIDAPTVVIHGSAVPLVPYQLGEDVASAIPGAEFVLVEGMGHEIPDELALLVAEAVKRVAAEA